MATITAAAPATSPDRTLATPIRWPLRAWIAVEVMFGTLAILTIGLAPQDTATNFAWPIKPDVMAAAIGAFYITSAVLFVPVLFARTWQHMRAVTLPTAAFATAMLLTTFLHWDKFSVGTVPFYVWFASYLLPPPIFVALYWWHQRHAAPIRPDAGRPIAGWQRACLAINGALLSGSALIIYLAPALLQRIAPWQFTPLTVRTICGWLIGLGLLQLALAREGEWDRMKLGALQLIALPLVLVLQIARFADQVRWGNIALWFLLSDSLLIAVLLVGLWVMDGQRRRGAALVRGR